MIWKKKLFVAGVIGLVFTILVIGVLGGNPAPDGLDDESDEFVKDERDSAFAMISLNHRWWETYATGRVETTSTSWSTLSGMARSCYCSKKGHLEVSLTVEYALTNVDDCEVRVKATKGKVIIYGKPGSYWLGRGPLPTTRIYQANTVKWVFENMAKGTWTVSIQWRSMNSGKITAARDRIMTVDFIEYPA